MEINDSLVIVHLYRNDRAYLKMIR